jgi:serine/threonine-protein kinase
VSSVQFLIGKQLGKYEITEHIGHGGMAEVYLGHQSNLGRQVAIKILHPFLAGEQGFVSRFQREARIVATMRHPNIVQVYDFDYHQELDLYYMVMEFIEGPTLKDRLENESLTVEKAGYIAAAVADALDYAHRREMVHRDIKPGNIMFTEDGDPVLADFGIARMLSLTGLTASGAMVGTPAYMAPEIGKGESGSAASDIYSLGIVLYEMLTGQLPFEADIPMSMVMKHINDPVPSPKATVRELSNEMDAVVLKALAKEPKQRYATAGKMSRALRQALDLEPARAIDTRPPKNASVTEKAGEENQPLLRVWSNQKADNAQNDAAGSQEGHEQRVPLLRKVLLTLIILVALAGGWIAARESLPWDLAEFLSVQAFGANSEATATATASPTAPATTEQVEVPVETATSTLTPTPVQTQTATASTQRAEVLRLYTNPASEAVLPEKNVLAYITLRNGGSAPWPEGTQLVFVRGEQMAAPSTLQLASVAVGEQVQVLLPLLAPVEAGTYVSVWEVQLPDGRSISSQIQLEIVVQEDLPTATATPTLLPEVTATPTAVTPLTVFAPELQDWQIDDEQGIWIGTLRFSAEGGVNDYRLYRGTIQPETELLTRELTFQHKKCQAFPLKIIATSGGETAVWEGEIPYPAPETCTP